MINVYNDTYSSVPLYSYSFMRGDIVYAIALYGYLVPAATNLWIPANTPNNNAPIPLIEWAYNVIT